jgi:hypothetical protein
MSEFKIGDRVLLEYPLKGDLNKFYESRTFGTICGENELGYQVIFDNNSLVYTVPDSVLTLKPAERITFPVKLDDKQVVEIMEQAKNEVFTISEQRRYELAKAAMAALISCAGLGHGASTSYICRRAMQYANAMMDELNKDDE